MRLSARNTANLQLEGLLLGPSKGVLNQQEIENLLQIAEETATQESSERGELSDANVDAVLFPIRFLRTANVASKQFQGFRSITELVAETKPR